MESSKELKNEKIRAFIAVDFPREAVKEILRIQNEIKKKNILIGKFTEEENLHLTLKFLGEIDKEKLEKVKEKLKELKFKKFQSYLGELGVFSSNFIKIVWIHLLGKQFLDMQKQIDETLKEQFEKEERFMSHLTIARVKKVKDKKLFLEELKKIKVSNIGFSVDRFYLLKSVLKSGGPEYSVIEKYDLD